MTTQHSELMARIAETSVDRRALLRTFGLGAVGIAALPLLAACTGTATGTGTAAASKTVSFGSGSSDDVPKRAYAAFTAAFEKKSGAKVTTNTVAHNDFQNNINT